MAAEVWVVAARRTPTGKAGGQFRHVPAHELAATALRAALADARVDAALVDEVILGNAVGPGGNLARLALLTAGLPLEVPGLTIDRQCGAGLDAVNLAAALIRAGEGRLYLAGGVESCSTAPLRLTPGATAVDGASVIRRAQMAPLHLGDPEMGEGAENVAAHAGITRAEQDEWALRSTQRALATAAAGRLARELAPVIVADGRLGKVQRMDRDETPRRVLPLAKLAALPPVFREGGTVTAGNSCRFNDGAAALALAEAGFARAHGLRPLARLVAGAAAGVDPRLPGLGPVPALQKACALAGLAPTDLDLVEINEAFAAQVLACIKALGFNPARVNPCGGALALGHPYGASGAICAVRLCHALAAGEGGWGGCALGIGGGLGVAAVFAAGPGTREGTP